MFILTDKLPKKGNNGLHKHDYSKAILVFAVGSEVTDQSRDY
jgi:hypothetical protein